LQGNLFPLLSVPEVQKVTSDAQKLDAVLYCMCNLGSAGYSYTRNCVLRCLAFKKANPNPNLHIIKATPTRPEDHYALLLTWPNRESWERAVLMDMNRDTMAELRATGDVITYSEEGTVHFDTTLKKFTSVSKCVYHLTEFVTEEYLRSEETKLFPSYEDKVPQEITLARNEVTLLSQFKWKEPPSEESFIRSLEEKFDAQTLEKKFADLQKLLREAQAVLTLAYT